MAVVTLAAGDQLSVGADAAGGKLVRLVLVSQLPGIYQATQASNLIDVGFEAVRSMTKAVIMATVVANDILDLAVMVTKQ